MQISQEEIRQLCRSHIEACEKWARLFIHSVLSASIGTGYLYQKKPDGNPVIKKSVIDAAETRRNREPGRYPTLLDAMVLEDIEYILCHPDFYSKFFSRYVKCLYPEGVSELRTFLDRIAEVRNKLAHVNPISSRDAERAICYSNDFIEMVKNYFTLNSMAKEFNIPNIVKISDSLGNEYLQAENSVGFVSITLLDPSSKKPKTLEFGDTVSVNLEMDPSFPETSYRLDWSATDKLEISENGKKIKFTIDNDLVGEDKNFLCRVISDKPWHRHNNWDQILIIHFKALPPRE